MSVIMVCLGSPESENYEGVLKLLGTLLSKQISYTEKRNILENEFKIPMKETLESEVPAMCNLSDGIEAEGIAKGTLKSIQALMETMHLTADQAMAALKIPEEERDEYTTMLKQ